jgi:hypothetical protein
MFGLSSNQTRFQFSNMCPLCSKFIVPQYRRSDGTKIFALTPLPLMDRSAIARCPKCKDSWSVFASSDVQEEPAHSVAIEETRRSEEAVGEDRRSIDNSRSAVALRRRFTMSREWSRVCRISQEDASTVGTSVNIGLDQLTSISSSAEFEIRNHYSVSTESREVYSEEIDVEVPASTKLCMVFSWKRLWQHGLAHVHSGQTTATLPYMVSVGLTFDQEQIDEV